jgi:hypothetical protein
MNSMSHLGKILIIAGIVITTAGILVALSPKIPWLGRLPGDLVIKRDNFRLYLPITTCIVVSLVLSLLLYLFRR